MKRNSQFLCAALWATVASFLAGAPSGAFAQSTPLSQRETAVAPEANPPGDIPDDQVFITYRSPEGFSLQVPEGWSRSNGPGGVTFADKYGRIVISATKVTKAPTEAGVKQQEIPDLLASGHALKIKKVRRLKLPAGNAVVVDYLSNSEVNSVTDRKIRLENRRIYYFQSGTEVVLTLSAPAGADNVDQWKMMAESFRWS